VLRATTVELPATEVVFETIVVGEAATKSF
jgi:hypothetical protein